MKVSVIISTFTEERSKDILKCINSILRQTRKADEILLVLDPVEELIEYYRNVVPNDVEVVRSKDFGLSAARNSGIENASGDVIVFIDDDAYAEQGWLEAMLKNYEDEHVWGVGGSILPAFDEGRPKWLPEELDWIVGCTYKGMAVKRREIRNPIGANMSFRKEVFEVAGLFKAGVGRVGKKLLGSEETELAMRWKELRPEGKIIYEPEAVVYHRVPSTRTKFGYALRRAYYEGYSKAILARNYSLGGEFSYLSFLIKESIPLKVKRMYLWELMGLVTLVFAVGVGNIVGRLKK